MEKFVVSARKYRPATFDTVVGQSHITTTLKNAIRTNHLAQAFLFCGPRGVGKTTCARILAKTINCQRLGDDIEPCDECESCKSFNHNASFNIHELDAASNNSVEDIRNLIDQVRFPPQSGKYKVYIIDEVHMLSQAAFNAFLKTLEEPPNYAIFILATTEKHKILPTILSRCQIFDFNRIQIKDIADHLASIAEKENIKADYQALELIAQKADGGLRDALSMFDLNVTFASGNQLSYQEVLDNLHILDYDYYFRMTDALASGNLAESLMIFNEILEKGFDGHQFVVGLNEHFRNLMVCKDAATVKLLQVSESVQKKYIEQSSKLQLAYLLSSLSIGSQIDLNYKASKNQRLHVEIGLMKLSQIQNVLSLSELPQSVSDVSASYEKKNNNVKQTQQGNEATRQQGNEATRQQGNEVTRQQGNEATGQSNSITKPSITSSKLKTTAGLESSVKIVEKNAKSTDNEPLTTEQAHSFTRDEVKRILNHFADERQNSTLEVMLKGHFDLEETTIKIYLNNQVQLDLLNQVKQDLAQLLRQKLKNSSIQLVAEMIETQKERRPYTAQEKFEFLAKKNPALWDLKDRLGLDLVF